MTRFSRSSATVPHVAHICIHTTSLQKLEIHMHYIHTIPLHSCSHAYMDVEDMCLCGISCPFDAQTHTQMHSDSCDLAAYAVAPCVSDKLSFVVVTLCSSPGMTCLGPWAANSNIKFGSPGSYPRGPTACLRGGPVRVLIKIWSWTRTGCAPWSVVGGAG